MRFLDAGGLDLLLWARETIGDPLTVNNWAAGGQYTQRGLRCNMCQLVKGKTRPYLSAHVLGKGYDFTAQNYSADECRALLMRKAGNAPCPFRMEAGVAWVHIDALNDGAVDKCVLFTD